MRVGVPGRDGALDRNWGERSGHEGELEKIWSLAYVVMRLRHGWASGRSRKKQILRSAYPTNLAGSRGPKLLRSATVWIVKVG